MRPLCGSVEAQTTKKITRLKARSVRSTAGGSTIITSNLPLGEWDKIFGSEQLASAVRDRLAAVVLLGVPSRRPSDPWQHGTTDPHPGIAARVAVDVPSELHNRMWGYTLDGDEISANRSGLRGLFDRIKGRPDPGLHELVQPAPLAVP